MSADPEDYDLVRPDIEPADPGDPSTIDDLIEWAAVSCTTITKATFTKEELFAEARKWADPSWQIKEDALEAGLSMASCVVWGRLRLR